MTRTASPTLAPCRWLVLACAVGLLAGCASGRAPTTADHGDAPANAIGERVADTAMAMRGRPYQWGGSSPATGFDCSGLVQYAYSEAGLRVPRTVDRLYDSVDRLYLRQLQRGDLVFFRIQGADAAHVGIYVGDDHFVHAPKSRSSVHVSNLKQDYWRERLVRAGSLDR